MRILIIEDYPEIAEVIQLTLKKANHETFICVDGAEGLQQMLSNSCDLVIMEQELPVMDGNTVVRESRQSGFDAPIIMLTKMLLDEREKEGVFRSGVDECLIHPLSAHDILASIRLLGQGRHNSAMNPTITYNGLTLRINKREMCYQGATARLSKRQTKIIELLLNNVGLILTKEVIIQHGWNNVGDESNFEWYIRSIRNVFLEVKSTLELRIVDNKGYCLQDKNTNKFARE